MALIVLSSVVLLCSATETASGIVCGAGMSLGTVAFFGIMDAVWQTYVSCSNGNNIKHFYRELCKHHLDIILTVILQCSIEIIIPKLQMGKGGDSVIFLRLPSKYITRRDI